MPWIDDLPWMQPIHAHGILPNAVDLHSRHSIHGMPWIGIHGILAALLPWLRRKMPWMEQTDSYNRVIAAPHSRPDFLPWMFGGCCCIVDIMLVYGIYPPLLWLVAIIYETRCPITSNMSVTHERGRFHISKTRMNPVVGIQPVFSTVFFAPNTAKLCPDLFYA